MKRVIFGLLALTLVMGRTSAAGAAGLRLTIRDGRVSLDAQDVTIRQILTEWARVGKTRIVNLERVNSGPVTVKFDGLSEDEALDIILRTLPGYMAAPRASAVADASRYDRILILPTTTAVAASAPPRGQSPLFQDPSANVTQLRPAAPPLNPGLLPEPPDDPRDSSDPAVIAAGAAGLVAVPAQQPGNGSLAPPQGVLQPPVRTNGGTLPAAQVPTTTTAPSNPWNAPVGASRPGPAPAPPSATTPPPNRAVGPRPQQADQ